MFVVESWRGQRVVGWRDAPPIRPTLLLPGAAKGAASVLPVGVRSGGSAPVVVDGVGGGVPSLPSPGGGVPGGGVRSLPSPDIGVPDGGVFGGGVSGLAVWRAVLVGSAVGEVGGVLRSRPERPVDCGSQDWAQVMVDSIAARQRWMSFLAAQQTRDLIELAATVAEVPDDSREFLGCELGLALGVADSTASGYLTEAIDLATRCPATLAALETGHITAAKAATIRRGTQDLPDDITPVVEADVLPTAGRCTMPELRNRIARSVIRRDPDGADHRHQKARTRRRISTRRDDDGMGLLWLYGTAQDIGTIAECIDALADTAKTDGDTRLIGERRVDALVDICADVLARGVFADRPLPEQHRRRPQLLVTIPATALLDTAGNTEPGQGEVADLAGYGPITPTQARVIAADATWRRLICDPTTGALLDYGRTTYTPPAALRDFILTRDKTCVMPGCRQPAHRCDIDHRDPFHPGQPSGGTTSATNCSTLCRRHHRAKDHGGYHLHLTPGGDHHWTTPLGRTHLREHTRLWDPPDKHDPTPSPQPIKPLRCDPDDPPPF